MKKFNYVVAHTWDSNPEALSCYTYHNEVHYGTLEDAEWFLTYVKEREPDYDWKIYKISIEGGMK